MDYRKKFGISSLVLIIIAIILSTSNQSGFILGDYILSKLGLPIWSDGNSGLHYSGILSAALILIGLFGLIRFSKYVHPDFGKKVFYILLISTFIYQPAINEIFKYAKSFSKGLSSIEYLRKDSNLSFKSGSKNKYIDFHGKVKLANYGFERKEFFIKVALPDHMKDISEEKELTIVDSNNNPIKFKLNPNEVANFNIDFSALQTEKVHNAQGSCDFDVILFNEDQEKKYIKDVYE